MSSDAGSIPAASTILWDREELKGPGKTQTRRLAFLVLFVFSCLYLAAAPSIKVTAQDYSDFSRVVITFPSSLSFSFEKDQTFFQVRIRSNTVFQLRSDPVRSRFIKSINWGKSSDLYIIVIETRHSNFRYDSFRIEKKRQLVIDFYPAAEMPAEGRMKAEEKGTPELSKKDEQPSGTEAQPSAPPPSPGAAASQGVRTIVIDPGHGGLESGAKGKFGALEKDITLAIGLKLKAVIEKNLAYGVELTRDKDIDVSLENRAALANNHKAELFISIHANSSYRRNAQGSETFFLSLNATDEEARRLAYLENTSADFESPLASESQDEIMMILWDLAQTAYLKQSQRLGEIIQDELNSLLGTANRGLKQAPFKVLSGVACPAVLVEVAFISNPEEERELVGENFQNAVAQAIYRGLVRYIKVTS